MNVILLGTLASLLAGSMTAVGALPVLLGRAISERTQDSLLGFSAGVMLAASFFSLLMPAIETAEGLHGGRFVPAAIVSLGFVLGMGAVAFANQRIPHSHFVQGRQGPASFAADKVWLFVAAITIHNFPEGMAVGVGFGSGDLERAISLAVGIGLQNAPEGLAVAVAVRARGYKPMTALLVAASTAVVEPVGGFLGAGAVELFHSLLPWALSFSAGAMIFVISHEIIPETHTRGNQEAATFGLALGMALMMFLDVAFR